MDETIFSAEYIAQNFLRLKDVKLGRDVKIFSFVNAYGCEIGDETKVGAFVEIQKNVKVGRRCKISSHSFICEGVTIEDHVFIGHGVMFTNDKFPVAADKDGTMLTDTDWEVIPTTVKRGASIGSGCILLPGIVVGENALIGAGAVVTRDVPANSVVAGIPSRVLRQR